MKNVGFTQPQNVQTCSVPDKKTDGVNINIYANTPGTCPMACPAYYYPYSSGYYYPNYYYPRPDLNYYAQQNNNSAPANTSIGAQNLTKEPPKPAAKPIKKEEKTEKKPDKKLTPLTNELLNGLSSMLVQGDTQARMHAIGQTLKLLREDVNTRKNDPRLIGLINTALHPSQPSEVQTAALIACNKGLIKGNNVTAQHLNVIANQKDQFGNDSLATSAISQLPAQALNSMPAGQRLNVISK